VRFDTTGKVSLDHIYGQPDPRAYFGTLRSLEYGIPELAKPYFADLIRKFQKTRANRPVTVLDLGCSYGINAALLKYGVTMEELYGRYAGAHAQELDRDTLLARDRALVRLRAGHNAAGDRIIGLDSSEPALRYALDAGFLDDAVCADLENGELTDPQRRVLAGGDLVTSTGCIGYIGASTIGQVAVAATNAAGQLPWMAHFVLRMVPFEPVAECLDGLGYETVRADRLFRQRRFVSQAEQSKVLDTLGGAGIDARGLEERGWFYAQLFVSRPRGEY